MAAEIETSRYMIITVNVFNIYDGRSMSVAIPWENYPVLETDIFRRWTIKTYSCYGINNKLSFNQGYNSAYFRKRHFVVYTSS